MLWTAAVPLNRVDIFFCGKWLSSLRYTMVRVGLVSSMVIMVDPG